MNKRLCKCCLVLKENQDFNKSGDNKLKRSCKKCTSIKAEQSNLEIF